MTQVSTCRSDIVSVIMPAFNARATIVEAIASVQAQSHPHWELIVIDDGSDDDTAELVEALCADDDRIILRRQDHDGVGVARAHGMRLACGEFIAFLDADDLFCPDKLVQQLAAMRANPDAGGVIGWVDRFTGSTAMRFPLLRDTPARLNHQDLVIVNWLGHGSNLLARTDALRSAVDPAECLSHTQDWELGVRLASRQPLVSVPQVVSLYRQRADSLSAELTTMDRQHRAVLRRWRRTGIVPLDRQAIRSSRVRLLLHLANRAQLKADPLVAAAGSLRYLLAATVRCGTDLSLRRDVWLTRIGTRRRLRRAITALADGWRQRRSTASPVQTTFEKLGLLPECRPLADPSVLAALARDAQHFVQAKQALIAAGQPNRVPYGMTDAIRRVSCDPALVATVGELFGEQTPWVMWGASISTGIPNAAQYWHADIESMYWQTLTVVVGIDGCTPDNVTSIVPGSHHLRCGTPGRIPFADTAGVLATANVLSPVCDQITSFSDFGNGRFYVFDAGAWHCGNPKVSSARTLLFLHYQRASEPRIPMHADFVAGTWLPEAAPYLECTSDAALAERKGWTPRDTETTLAPAPPPH